MAEDQETHSQAPPSFEEMISQYNSEPILKLLGVLQLIPVNHGQEAHLEEMARLTLLQRKEHPALLCRAQQLVIWKWLWKQRATRPQELYPSHRIRDVTNRGQASRTLSSLVRPLPRRRNKIDRRDLYTFV